MNAEKHKRIRIAILELLKTQYPGAIDTKVLKFSLDNLGYPLRDEDINGHLAYLTEKAFVFCDRREGFGFHLTFCTLTARGWDVIDGNIHEAGIDEEL